LVLNLQAVEGFFLVTDDDHIFEVKGDIHPKNRLVAYLRYLPTQDGNRISSNGVRYRKITSLKKREDYLQRMHSEYLWFDETRGRLLQAVPLNRIAFALNPVDCLRQFRDMERHSSSLQQASLDLVQTLIDATGIEWEAIGLTGSQLVGLASSESDIDLVIYGEKSARKVYSILKEQFHAIGDLGWYADELLDKHVKFRWGENPRWCDVLRKVESKKVLQGLFGGYEFFIRMVKSPDEIGYEYEDFEIHNEGTLIVKCHVTDDHDSIFTPCAYGVQCNRFGNLRRLVSYRGRFTEQVSKGMDVEAKGRLESVADRRSGEEFSQLVLGENWDDYLIPL
jgi:predicted nucleotidyltransferase